MPHRLIPAAAMLAAALVPAAALGQTDVRISPLPDYNLVQLTVSASAVPADEFQTRTMEITSCKDAVNLGKALGAKINRSNFTKAGQLPPQLRPLLKDLPNGMASPVLSEGGDMLHVLVVCSRA
ncbi:MAG: hypothetical protein GW858_04280 [Sphingomonadales bacterium]|nr:hypothetical protein [Sphingomonadales bacterium]NCQ22115.1 hypothetical protein [Sphingomonadales bacterium]NCT03220.1 hypothetical protein [Sphingomonadales bacterium]